MGELSKRGGGKFRAGVHTRFPYPAQPDRRFFRRPRIRPPAGSPGKTEISPAALRPGPKKESRRA
jgi:hypothetical protein